jgi:4,5-DOPA dioxygenase extradiol
MIPSAFISHGAPDRVIKQSSARSFLEGFARSIRRPEGIVVISAHWQTEGLCISKSGTLETIHDFWGFPSTLYEQQYPAVQSTDLTRQIEAQLNKSQLPYQIQDRGLDHGAWSVLTLAYPAADIPVITISLPIFQQGDLYLQLGQALASLRQNDILILGSGSAIHNLKELNFNEAVPEWAKQFKEWLHENVEQLNYGNLTQLYSAAPHGKRAHPSIEHYSPLLVAMGAALNEKPLLVHDSDEYGALNNSSWLFGA